MVEALNARDLPAYFAHTCRDYEIRTHRDDGAIEVVAGRRGIERFFEAFLGEWDELTYEFLEGPEVVKDVIISHDRWSARGPSGGRHVIIEYFAVGHFRDGRLAAMDSFLTRQAADRYIEELPG